MFLIVITDELFGLLSSQPEDSFTCSLCSEHQTERSSLKEELQSRLIAGLEEVLSDLLSANTTQHLLLCRVVRTCQWHIDISVILTFPSSHSDVFGFSVLFLVIYAR